MVSEGQGVVSQRWWSVKDRGWCPSLGGHSRTGGGVPEEVVSQGQGMMSGGNLTSVSHKAH